MPAASGQQVQSSASENRLQRDEINHQIPGKVGQKQGQVMNTSQVHNLICV